MSLKIALPAPAPRSAPITTSWWPTAEQPARWPLHREVGQLQPDAAGRSRRPHPAAERAHHPLAGEGALPTDRVAKFLGHAGLAPMPTYAEQPIQSAPKKKAQERAKAAAGA